MPICEIEGCEKPSIARKLCSMHYNRLKKHGDPGDATPRRVSGRVCCVPDCGKPAVGHQLCWKHYERRKRWGSADKRSVLRGDEDGRFWQKVDKDGPVPEARPDLGPCWQWTGFIPENGYGRFWINGENVGAHRYSYSRFVGPIPEGFQVDHLCRNRRCVNPDHLEAVTCRDNLMRSEGGGSKNSRKTHCKRGHPLSGNNLTIRKNGARRCKQCAMMETRRYRKRKAENE